MSTACIYYKPNKNESTQEIQSKIYSISKKYKKHFSSIKILVESEEFSQLDIFLNRELNNYDVLIVVRPIEDEFYNIVLKQLQDQGYLKLIQEK